MCPSFPNGSQLLPEPGQVFFGSPGNWHRDNLGGLIAVHLCDAVAQGEKPLLGGFNKEKSLLGSFDLSLPAINAVNGWEDIYASCKAIFDDGVGYADGLLLIGAGTEHDYCICHEYLS